MKNKQKGEYKLHLDSKIDPKIEFTPTFEVVLLERNSLGEPYEDRDKRECKLCRVIHPYRVKHYLATSAGSIASQFDHHRRKHPLPKRKKKKSV